MRRAMLAGAVGLLLLSTGCMTSGGPFARGDLKAARRAEAECRERAARVGHQLRKGECVATRSLGRAYEPSSNRHSYRMPDGRLEPVPIDPRTGEVDRRAWSR
jgi:hypothetical protein